MTKLKEAIEFVNQIDSPLITTVMKKKMKARLLKEDKINPEKNLRVRARCWVLDQKDKKEKKERRDERQTNQRV